MQAFEFAILDWIRNTLQCDFLDSVVPVISGWINHGEIWIMLALVLLLIRKTRWIGVSVALALVIDFLCCNIILKPLVARVRPCDVNTAITLLIAQPNDFSFPSGHTAVSFAAAAALKASGCRLWIAACVIAIIMGFTRLYLYVHWPSDVVAGAIVGVFAGFAGHRLSLKLRNLFTSRKL